MEPQKLISEHLSGVVVDSVSKFEFGKMSLSDGAKFPWDELLINVAIFNKRGD